MLRLLLSTFILSAIPAAGASAESAPPAPPVPSRPSAPSPADRAALAAQCEELIAATVRSPFGWGWAEVGGDAEPPRAEPEKPARAKRRPAAGAGRKPASINAAESAVLGLELYWAGEALGEPKYQAAAFEVARGVASLQTRTGQIRAQGTPGGGGAARPEAGDVPDRAPTRAALALMLTLIEADRPAPDALAVGTARDGNPPNGAAPRRWAERLKGPAAHAAHWLGSQQAASGAWPSAYPPDAPFGKGYRVIRLDSSDYRDNVCALLLAGEVLDDAELRRLADHAVDGLLALRVPNWRTGARGLWPMAAALDGDPPRRFPELNRGYDLLATRYAMQAMLATYLVTLQPKGNDALTDAARALAALPRQEQKWVRFYSWRGELASVLPAPQPTPFGPDRPPIDDGSFSAFGLMPTLDALTQINAVGGQKYSDFLAATRPIHARLAEQICGLSDEVLGLRLPKQPGAADGLAPSRAEGGDKGGEANDAGKSDKPAAGDAASATGEAPAASRPDAPGISDRAVRLWQSLRKFMAEPGRP